MLIVTRNADQASRARQSLLCRMCEVEIHAAQDGSEARGWLSARRDDLTARECPDLIMLDLGSPASGALECLCALKQDEALRAVPVIVVAPLLPDDDVRAAYRAGAASCLPRGEEAEDLLAVIDALGDYWFGLVCLPHDGGWSPGRLGGTEDRR